MNAARTRRLVAVAAAVLVGLLLAACGGGGGASELSFEATEFEFDPSEATAATGEISVSMENVGEQRHTWVIEGREDQTMLDANAGESDSGTVDLEAGDYVFYCDVPGHREAGMEGTLTVEG